MNLFLSLGTVPWFLQCQFGRLAERACDEPAMLATNERSLYEKIFRTFGVENPRAISSMRRPFTLCAIGVLLLANFCEAAEKATVSGKVTDVAGKPLEHAAVLVYSAGVRTGYSIFFVRPVM